MKLDDYLTVEEIARETGLSVATIRGYISKKTKLKPKLTATKLGGKLNIVTRKAFEAWKRERAQKDTRR